VSCIDNILEEHATSIFRSKSVGYVVQLCRQAVPQHSGRKRKEEATENFLAVLNLTMTMEAVCSSKRIATQPTSTERINIST
jgi:hypothetical protein